MKEDFDEVVLAKMQPGLEYAQRTVARLLGVSDYKAYMALLRLVDCGKLEKVKGASSRAVLYRLPVAAKKDVVSAPYPSVRLDTDLGAYDLFSHMKLCLVTR